MKSLRSKGIPILLLALALSCLPTYANVRIMSYNIKDFWLRFDGDPGSITDQGAEVDRDDLERQKVSMPSSRTRNRMSSEY